METVTIPKELYDELIAWFDKFSKSPILHDQGIPERLKHERASVEALAKALNDA